MNSTPPLSPVRGARWWVTRGVAGLAAVTVGAVAWGAVVSGDDRRGEVVRVVDGDTLIALVDGEETTIRLLNIDTPETKDPDEAVQCLGPEAAEFLAERLPAGTEIELDYDEERLDRYDRTLAAVYESESLINAEIAAAGLGVPVYFAPNDRFLPEVEDAARSAQSDGSGLYSSQVECALPAQLAVQSTAVEAIPATVDGDPADALAAAALVVEDVDLFVAGLTPAGLSGLGNAVMASSRIDDYLENLGDEASEVQERAQSAHGTLAELKTEYDQEQERLEQERKEREEQERREREEEERQEEERKEREEQERREQEEQAREEQRSSSSQSSSTPSPSSTSGTKNSSGGSSSQGDSGASSGSSSGSSCVPYGPEIPHSDAGGYTGKRYGMPGGKTFRKCS